MKNKLEKLRNSQALTYDDLRGNGILQADPERDFAAGWDACQATLMPQIEALLATLKIMSAELKDTINTTEIEAEMTKAAQRRVAAWETFIGDES